MQARKYIIHGYGTAQTFKYTIIHARIYIYIYIYMSFTFTYMKFIPSSLSLSLPFSSSTRPSLHFSKLSNYNLTNKYSYIRIFHQTHL